MPFIVECEGLKGKQLETCMDYYSPIYQRNVPALGECLDGEKSSIECMKLYGAICEWDPKPPAGAKPRKADPRLYNKYIKPNCDKNAPKKEKKAGGVAGAFRFLSNAIDFIKRWS